MPSPRLWPMARALSQLRVTPMIQPIASSPFDIDILRSVRGDTRRTTETPRRPNGAGGRRTNFERNGLGFAEAVDHAGCVKKRVQLVNDWLEAEGDFHAFSGSPGDRASLGRPRNPKGLLKAGPHIREIRLCCRIKSKSIHGHLL